MPYSKKQKHTSGTCFTASPGESWLVLCLLGVHFKTESYQQLKFKKRTTNNWKYRHETKQDKNRFKNNAPLQYVFLLGHCPYTCVSTGNCYSWHKTTPLNHPVPYFPARAHLYLPYLFYLHFHCPLTALISDEQMCKCLGQCLSGAEVPLQC